MTRLALLALLLALGCSKTAEKPSKDDEAVEKDSKKKKASEDDELTHEAVCKRIGKLVKKETPDLDGDKLERKVKQCVKKMEAEPHRKKCVVTCLADHDTFDEFDKCDRACRDNAKSSE